MQRQNPEPRERLQPTKPFSEKPAAFQREPERNPAAHGNHLHSHGPTVDAAVIKMLTYKEISFSFKYDVVTLVYGIFMLAIVFLGYHFRENIIIDEIYEKFQAGREAYKKATPISMSRLIPEIIKFFSLCAYDILIIMYLIKPLKQATKEERDLTKNYQDLLKKLGSDRPNVQENIKKIEAMQAKKTEMISHRYTVYNATMLQELKLGLSLNFILSTFGMLSFFITSVDLFDPDLYQGRLSNVPSLLRDTLVRRRPLPNGS